MFPNILVGGAVMGDHMLISESDVYSAYIMEGYIVN